jgi:hypothetical protein
MSSLLHDARSSLMRGFVNWFNKPISILEIGTWYGLGSTKLWLEELKEGSSLTVMDLWRPYSNDGLECTEILGDLKSSYDGWKSTINEIQKFEEENFKKITINLIRGDSRPLLEQLQSNLFDLIYIDGDHRYDGCLYDMQQAKRLIKEGGLICGDDHETIITDYNVHEYRNNPNKIKYHPGVGLAIYDAFHEVNSMEGFWWIHMENGELSL